MIWVTSRNPLFCHHAAKFLIVAGGSKEMDSALCMLHRIVYQSRQKGLSFQDRWLDDRDILRGQSIRDYRYDRTKSYRSKDHHEAGTMYYPEKSQEVLSTVFEIAACGDCSGDPFGALKQSAVPNVVE